MKTLLCILLLIPAFFSGNTAAAITSELEQMVDTTQLQENLSEDADYISGEPDLSGKYDWKKSMSRLYNKALEQFSNKLEQELGFGAKIIALSMFSSVILCFSNSKSTAMYINLAACCSAALMLAGDLDSVTKQALDAVMLISDYSKAAMPVIFSAAALCGTATASAAKYAAASLVMDLLISACVNYIVPLINLFISISISRSLFDNSILAALSKFIKWCTTTLMTTLTMAFTAYLAFTGIIAGSTANAAVKATRTIIANGLPIIGKILSDTSSVILAGAALIKNSVGVYSMIAVAGLCIGPFISLAVKMLVFKAAAALADMLPGSKL